MSVRSKSVSAFAGSKSKQKSFFTLIELLVVMAIIMLLAGLMFPVFAYAREHGRRTNCLSNIKQLGISNNMYANDNKGFFAPGRYSDNITHWCGGKTATGWDPKGGTLSRYYNNEKIKLCPSFASFLPTGFAAGSGGYGYDKSGGFGGKACLSWPQSDDTPVNISELGGKGLSSLVMFSDSAITDDYTPNGNIIEYPEIMARSYTDTPWGVFNPVPCTHFRHNGKANSSFADGHAETLEPATYQDGNGQNFEAKNLGFVDESLYLKLGNY